MSAQSIEDVVVEELAQVEASRALRLDANGSRPPANNSLIGLAFSGGGIRSATFNLGVLEAFAQKRLLRVFDYLSTVSGGGYIGGWLMAWMHHSGQGIGQIEEQLAPHPYSLTKPADPPSVRFLRSYSNYLTPRKGILGGDFWAFVASYLRNMLLNQFILLLLLAGLLLLPRAIAYVPHLFEAEEEVWQWTLPLFGLLRSQDLAMASGILLGAVAVIFMGRNLAWVEPPLDRKYPWYTKQVVIHAFIVVPLFLSAAFFSYGLRFILPDWQDSGALLWRAPVLGVCLYLVPWIAAFAFCKMFEGGRLRKAVLSWKLVLGTGFAAGALTGFLLLPYTSLLRAGLDQTKLPWGLWHVLTFGTPALAGIMLLAGALHSGLMGRGMSDAHREWWARLGGWLGIYNFFWLFLFLVAIYVPVGLSRLWASPLHHKYTVTGSLTWVISTLYGVLFGRSKNTAQMLPSDPIGKKILSYLARATPYIFILGLLAGVSVLDAKIALMIASDSTPLGRPPSDIVDELVPLACAAFFLAALALSWRVDVNEFSMHHLYRNRLVRCYLGASVPNRTAQPFTGFSTQDDVPLAALKISPGSTKPNDAGPIPILNASLNVVRGAELALQTRKARSFTFTPLYCGFTRATPLEIRREAGYAPTEDGGSRLPGHKGGVRLGTAVAISGAAASPNMGYHSSPSLAFLMTIFDVRLGWWIGNPQAETWKQGSPRLGFYWLLRELFGAASDNTPYVYLSDGGHFENLAIYELVRRGCRLIVASDASCDGCYAFGDLHNAIERCRADFGVEIELDPSALKPQNGVAGKHFAVGKIHYTPGSPADDGVLVYLKPTLVAADSCDLLGYAAVNRHFPHDPTADQWFDETQFENYRALGRAVGLAAGEDVAAHVERLLAPASVPAAEAQAAGAS